MADFGSSMYICAYGLVLEGRLVGRGKGRRSWVVVRGWWHAVAHGRSDQVVGVSRASERKRTSNTATCSVWERISVCFVCVNREGPDGGRPEVRPSQGVEGTEPLRGGQRPYTRGQPACTLGRGGAPAPRSSGPVGQRRAERDGGICTSGQRPFEDGTAETVSRDVFYVVLEFSDPVRGEALTGYGNWHVPDRSTSTTD